MPLTSRDNLHSTFLLASLRVRFSGRKACNVEKYSSKLSGSNQLARSGSHASDSNDYYYCRNPL